MSDTISRKGVFIPDITVEMFRNASLESIEDLMASGEMEDILLPSAQPEIIRCKDCLWRIGRDCTRFTDLPVYMDDYCGRAKRRGEQDEEEESNNE